MAEDLRCFLEDRPILALRVGPVERLGRWCLLNRTLAALTGTTLFLLIMVAVVATVGYVRIKNALKGESSERAKAEANAGLALEALDRMFDRLSPSRVRVLPQPSCGWSPWGDSVDVPSSPILSKENAALLEEMLAFLRPPSPAERETMTRCEHGTAEANRRVGAIRQARGQLDDALNAYHRATGLYRELLGRKGRQTRLSNWRWRRLTTQRWGGC